MQAPGCWGRRKLTANYKCVIIKKLYGLENTHVLRLLLGSTS